MEKLVTADPELTTKIYALHGDQQSIPKGIRKAILSKTESLGRLGHYSIIGVEFRQLFRPRPTDKDQYWPFGVSTIASGHFFFFLDHTGIAYLWTGTGNDPAHGYAWWEFGCKHKNSEHKTLGNCYHGYTCKDCGYYWTEDSSG